MDYSKGIGALVGLTLSSVRRRDGIDGGEELLFQSECGRTFRMYHCQDCCEVVRIEDICGDIKDLLGTPIITAEKRTNAGENDEGTETWTFYEIGTRRGSVTIRWFGTSNGYYSEEVSFTEIKGAV